MNSTIVELVTPLPCATRKEAGTCGKPATVAYAYPQPDGGWLLQPICKECTEATARLYKIIDGPIR